MCVAPPLLVCLRRFAYSVLFIAVIANAQRIDISKLFYRYYLDFGQGYGAFNGENSGKANTSNGTTLTGKDGTKVSVPNVPNFSASSNYGSLTSVGRGFAVTANHVSSPESVSDLRKWGLTDYNIAKQPVSDTNGNEINGVSKPYGSDTKFLRFDKYVVEGQVDLLDIDNTTSQKNLNSTQENQNLATFKDKIKDLQDDKGNIYLYQAGSGIVSLRGTNNPQGTINPPQNGEMRGGGFGNLIFGEISYNAVNNAIAPNDESRGIHFAYLPNTDFNNRISSGDSGSGIYAYDNKNQKWILLGVTSMEWGAKSYVSFASNKDLQDYKKNFEQEINLKIQDPAVAYTWALNGNNLKFEPRGDTPKQTHTLQNNKDIIFRGGGKIEVQSGIYRNNSGYAGGFVFEAENSASAKNPTKYIFTNKDDKTANIFAGSGLDIGQNVVVEWALRNKSNDSLHKIGKGELIVKTDYEAKSGENLGMLKIGEGKVTLDTTKKAFENIYITSGRGELALVSGKAQALGATKNGANSASGTTSANSYKLAQENTNNMGFYFGKGGGKFDLAGNSLVLNTIAANDSGATITSATKATLEIQGLEYDLSGNKTQTKKDTIIHASIGDTKSNIDLKYSGKNATNSATTSSLRVSKANAAIQESSKAHLIFDGNINTSGKMEVTNGNIALQGHATTHATISDTSIIDKIKTAESGTSQKMPDYMDLSKPSHLEQPDWDNRTFKFGTGGITLTNSNLTLGRNASLDSNITLDNSSKIEFGGSVKHFIDNKDGKNVTGSGFSYQQEVESGNIGNEQTKANQTISYKGTITATGGTIESHILDFNASLNLKGATLTADYLTIEKSNTIKLENGASASVKTLKLQNVSDSNLNTIFANSNTTNSAKLKVTEALWFNSVGSANSPFDLSKLEANVEIEQNYDIRGVKSTITGNTKDLIANVSLFEEANLTLQSLTLKNTNANEVTTNGTTNTIKNSVYLQGESSQANSTKLTLNQSLKADNLDKAQIILVGKSEISTPKIEFSGVKNGILALDKDSKLTGTTGTNGKANVEVSGTNSSLQIGILGDKEFDINAQGGSKIILSSLPLQDSEVKNPSSKNVDSSPNAQNNSVVANFSGKISASGESSVESLLDTITASVILNKSDSNKNDNISGKPSLNAKNITLDSTHNEIYLGANSTLTAQTITAKSLTNLTLNADSSATANITKFIFDGEKNGTTTNLMGNLIGENIELKNSTIKTTDLTFNNKQNTTLELDKDSKLDITNLKVENANLTLNFADSTTNAQSLKGITLSNGANLNINKWDFKNTTTFTSNDNSRVNFQNATYTQGTRTNPTTTDSISGNITISNSLSLDKVGADSSKSDDRFKSLTFSDNLTFGESAKITVSLDSSIKKSNSSNITLGQFYTIISAKEIFDNRTDSRIDFIFDSSLTEAEKFFVVGKFIDNKLQVKFLEYDPRTFNELNKHISSKYSEILKALTEHNPNDISIDTAVKTDNYGVLETKLKSIDSNLNEIAQGNKTRQTRNLLFSNDQTINTRISQVRLAHSGRNKHLRFAQNDAMYRIQSLMQGAVRSDAMPSYARERESDLPNSVWLNVGGGYFGGDSKMGFGATNIGYDRLFDADNGSVLVGAMLGFGGSKAQTGEFIDSAMFYNIGLYLHSLFCAQGGEFGGHEIQSNISFSINDNRKTYNAKSAKNTAFGTLFALYYKYNFILAQNDTISHALKPVAVLALGYNRNGAFEINEYKQATYNSVNFSYGLGVEYNAVMSESFYSLALTLKDMAYSGSKSVFMSLSGAQNFIGYSLESAPRFSAEINLIGSHKLTDALYLQYGIAGMVDSGANYGAKGDIKLGYKF